MKSIIDVLSLIAIAIACAIAGLILCLVSLTVYVVKTIAFVIGSVVILVAVFMLFVVTSFKELFNKQKGALK